MVRTKVKQALRDMAKKDPCRNRQPPRSEEASRSGSRSKVHRVHPSSFRESPSAGDTTFQSSFQQFTPDNVEEVDERRTTVGLAPSRDAGVAHHVTNQPNFPIRLPPAHRTDDRIESHSRPIADINLHTVVREHQQPRPRIPVLFSRSEILRRYWVQEQCRESGSSCGLTDSEMTELLMDLQEEQKQGFL